MTVHHIRAADVAAAIRYMAPDVGVDELFALMYHGQAHHVAWYGRRLFAGTIWDWTPEFATGPAGYGPGLRNGRLNTIGYVVDHRKELAAGGLPVLKCAGSETPQLRAFLDQAIQAWREQNPDHPAVTGTTHHPNNPGAEMVTGKPFEVGNEIDVTISGTVVGVDGDGDTLTVEYMRGHDVLRLQVDTTSDDVVVDDLPVGTAPGEPGADPAEVNGALTHQVFNTIRTHFDPADPGVSAALLVAAEAVRVVARAGRLLPEAMETRTEFEVRWHDDADDTAICAHQDRIGWLANAVETGQARVGQHGIVRFTVWRREHQICAAASGGEGQWSGPWAKVNLPDPDQPEGPRFAAGDPRGSDLPGPAGNLGDERPVQDAPAQPGTQPARHTPDGIR